MTKVNFADLWDQLLSEGKSSFTVADLVERTGATPNAVYGAAKYAIDRKRLFSPVRGLYVVVPPEHRSWGVTPATHFIDPMMRHLGTDYYVAFRFGRSVAGRRASGPPGVPGRQRPPSARPPHRTRATPLLHVDQDRRRCCAPCGGSPNDDERRQPRPVRGRPRQPAPSRRRALEHGNDPGRASRPRW